MHNVIRHNDNCRQSVSSHNLLKMYRLTRFRKNLIFLTLTHCCLLVVVAFNIDTKSPYFIRNLYNGGDAHFGASVTLVAAEDNSEKNKEGVKNDPTGWIFIGAPKANSTYSSHLKINGPGVIWRCAIGRGMKPMQDDCRVMNMDPTGEYDPKNPLWAHQDRKDGAWIGGTMAAGRDRFVTCGSRWVNQKYSKDYLMNGICYWVPRSHVTAPLVNSTWPWLPPKFSYRLLGLLKKDRQTFTIKRSNDIKDVRHDWFLGQMGFSINIPQNSQEMILGAPGVYEWTGTVIQFRDALNASNAHRRFNAHPSSNTFADILVVRIRKSYYDNSQLKDNDYFGYSVSSGNFLLPNLSNNRTQYAAGAPRSDSLSGKVMVFSFRDTSEKQVAELDYLTPAITISDKFNGSYASYFGYSILAIDIDGNRFDDLLIGAPLFTLSSSDSYGSKKDYKIYELYSETAKPQPSSSGDEGCVFIFNSNGTHFELNSQHLCGRVPGARFGTALVSLGDINFDGIPDFAVGAPYENDRGAVYIYHGGHQATLVQKLCPEDISSSIRTFGYSLSSADVDSNGYLDLAVGAYETNDAIIFRTIPVVKFDASLSTSISKLLPPKDREFQITSCVSYTGKSVPDGLWLHLKLDLLHPYKQDSEVPEKILTLIAYKTDISSNVSHLLQPLTSLEQLMYFRKSGTCYNFTAHRISRLDDRPREVKIKQLFTIHTEEQQMNSNKTEPISWVIDDDGNGNPILHMQSEKTAFPAALPLSDRNGPTEVQLKLPIGTVCEVDGNPMCTADLGVQVVVRNSEGEILSQNNPFVIGSSETLLINVELWNHRELAKLPIKLDIIWFDALKIRKTSQNCEKLKGRNDVCRCFAQRAIHENDRELFQVQFDVNGIIAGGETADILRLLLKASTTSKIKKLPFFNYDLPLTYKVEFLETTFNHSATFSNSYQSDFLNFSQTLEIGITGPSSVNVVRLEMDIPTFFFLEDDWQELTIIRRPLIIYDGLVYRCNIINGTFLEDTVDTIRGSDRKSVPDFEDIGWDGFVENSTYLDAYYAEEGFATSAFLSEEEILRNKVHGRLKRDAQQTSFDIRKLTGMGANLNHLQLDCESSQIRCAVVQCDLKHFPKNSKASLEFKLRLRNKLAERIMLSNPEKQYQSIRFETVGLLTMIDTKGQQFGPVGQVKAVTVIALPELSFVPVWIIVYSVLGGLLLLSLIVIVLIKCGFFHREDKEKLDQLQAANKPDHYFE